MTAIYKRSRIVKTTDRAITKWQKPSNAQISNYAQYFGFKVVTNINATMTDRPTGARDKKILTPTETSVAYVTITTHNVPTTYYQTLLLINALWALFTRFCFTICSNLPCVSFQMAFSCLSCIFAASTLKLRFL